MTTLDDWKQDSEYGWSHPTGWNIGRYIVNGTPVFMLWHGGERGSGSNGTGNPLKAGNPVLARL